MNSTSNSTNNSPVSKSLFRHHHPLRVRWSEIDLQKIVFNPHYLTYFDVSVTEYWRKLAMPYELTLDILQGDLFVKKASIEYHASARLDDLLHISLRCDKIGRSSMTFKGAIFRSNELLVESEIIYVFADPNTQTSKAIPENFKSILNDFEAGREITSLKIGSWDELRPDALSLRNEIFVKEQGVPAELEEDAFDSTSTHAVLYNFCNLPIATARLVKPESSDNPLMSRVGRMAVRKDMRGVNWGSKVLMALEQVAKHRGDELLYLHAQTTAKSFYERNGFTARGPLFEEAGIEHIEMIKSL